MERHAGISPTEKSLSYIKLQTLSFPLTNSIFSSAEDGMYLQLWYLKGFQCAKTAFKEESAEEEAAH